MAAAIKSSGRDIDGEHRAIVEAVLAGDAEQATREIARHVERTTAAIAEVHRWVGSGHHARSPWSSPASVRT